MRRPHLFSTSAHVADNMFGRGWTHAWLRTRAALCGATLKKAVQAITLVWQAAENNVQAQLLQARALLDITQVSEAMLEQRCCSPFPSCGPCYSILNNMYMRLEAANTKSRTCATKAGGAEAATLEEHCPLPSQTCRAPHPRSTASHCLGCRSEW